MQPQKIFTIILLIQVSFVAVIYIYLNNQHTSTGIESPHIQIISSSSSSTRSSLDPILNKFCEYAQPQFNNTEALNEIQFEWGIMKQRNDQCYHSNRSHFHLYLIVSIGDLDLNSYDSIHLKQQLNKRKELLEMALDRLYVIKLDIEYLKLNLKLNNTPHCEAYRFDRILNDDRFRGRLSPVFVFESIYNHQLIIKEHGFYHIYCKTDANAKKNIFDEIKFILPRNMNVLNQERNILIEMEKKHFERFNQIDYLDLITSRPIKECETHHENETNTKMNVFILGMDSMSKNHLMRMFPKTYTYLTQEMSHNVFFQHHNSVAENTLGNLLALFSGCISEVNQDLNISAEFDKYIDKDKTYFDGIPFIWKDYERMGYLSYLSEDYPMLGMFQYLRKGFRFRPSSVYMMPFWYKYEDIRNEGPSCHNNKHSFNLQFENLNHFFDRINSKQKEQQQQQPAYFAFNFMKYFTHDFFTFPPEYDTRLSEFLRNLELKGYLDNTLFVLMSDHGARTTSHTFITETGRTERNLPFMSIRLPKKLWYSNEERNLIENSLKLTTHFDTFKTLRHFYYLNNNNKILNSNPKCKLKLSTNFKSIQSLRGISLLEQLPNDRSCSDALIPNIYCTCNQKQAMNESEFQADTNGIKFNDLIEKSMNAINQPTDSFRSKCKLFSYEKLLSVKKQLLSSMYFYEFRYKVEPGNAIFAVYYRYVFYNKPESQRKLELYLKTVRLSRYGQQSNCMTDKNLMGYCYCI